MRSNRVEILRLVVVVALLPAAARAVVFGTEIPEPTPDVEWAAVLHVGETASSTGILCSGAFLNEHWVITAAHCFGSHPKLQPPALDTISVSAPHTGFFNSGQVDSIVLHPDFIEGAAQPGRLDLALVHLAGNGIFLPKHHQWQMPLHVGANVTEVMDCYGYGQDTTSATADGRAGHLHRTYVIVTQWTDHGTFRVGRTSTRGMTTLGDSGAPCFASTPSGPALAGTISETLWKTEGSGLVPYDAEVVSVAGGSSITVANWIDKVLGTSSPRS